MITFGKTFFLMRSLIICLFCCFSFSCTAQKSPEKITVQYKDLSKKNDQLALDIYPVQNGKNLPVVVFVHGGAWMLGDKKTKIQPKVRLFNFSNYVFVSVNYRLSSFFNTKVQYPSHPNDVADAVKWLYQNIHQYGGNPDNMVLMGHSAGAQIVSLLGTSEAFLPQRGIPIRKIKGVISIDTEGYDVAGMGSEGVKIYRRIFGEDAQQWRAASPLLNIRSGSHYPPFLIATRGQTYRKEISSKFADALKKAGAEATLIDVDPYSHFESNNKIGTEGEKIITPHIMLFLKLHFAR